MLDETVLANVWFLATTEDEWNAFVEDTIAANATETNLCLIGAGNFYSERCNRFKHLGSILNV
jgi:hypothetical protein